MENVYLYNTLTRRKEAFLPLDSAHIRMYACGVTVYDKCHIGHGRSLYVFSLLKSVLRAFGYKVTFVRNITDIDDKIIKRILDGNNNSPVSIAELNNFTEKFIKLYYEDLSALSLPKADYEPRATEYIDKMIDFIGVLIEKGYAYATEMGNVYYSVKAFNGYGKLSGRNIEELLKGVRKGIEEDKKDPLDFALWKSAKENEPHWQSPWGNGRPGWHLECAVMSTDILGKGFDIHGGGIDLVFPHHENEIAEAEPVIENRFATYWIHHGMVTVNGEKMSKSLGNFITLRDAIDRYGPEVLKMWFLTSHYRSPIDMSEERIKSAGKMYEKISMWIGKLSENPGDNSLDEFADRLEKGVFEALADDINTPNALGAIFTVINDTFEHIKSGKGSEKLLQAARKIFGILLINICGKENSLGEDFIDLLLEARSALRRHKEFSLADKIRGRLLDAGIIVEDTPQGPRWVKK